ncbi:MAG: hypothetical protein HY815_06755 [Candidatus Riflebacteria bacterium]|nr:hypothetical protein [Candidatus Riflebacteria bacterium]
MSDRGLVVLVLVAVLGIFLERLLVPVPARSDLVVIMVETGLSGRSCTDTAASRGISGRACVKAATLHAPDASVITDVTRRLRLSWSQQDGVTTDGGQRR